MDIGKGEPQMMPEMTTTYGEAPSWVLVMPNGAFRGRDGRGPYNAGDPQGIIQRTLAYFKGADIPVDYDHQLLFTRENGQPAVAAGWIKEFRTDDKGVWAKVEWTSRGASYVISREYRYVSPVFKHDDAGTVLYLVSVGLTNLPNLELVALSSTDLARLSAEDVAVCSRLGISPADFMATRREEQTAMHTRSSLSPEETSVCIALGISPQDYMKTRDAR